MTENQQEHPAATMGQKRRRPFILAPTIPWLIAACAVLALFGALTLLEKGTQPDAGATVSDYQGMTRDEIQAELDRTVRENMMTISVAARATVDSNDIVRINAVNDKDNKFSQRFSLIQDGQVVYESGAVEPGQTIESCHAEGIRAGEAFIEIQAVDTESRKDHGNPTRVKVEVIESQA